MMIRPSRSGLCLLAGYLAFPGLLTALILLLADQGWIGLAVLILWFGGTALLALFRLRTLLVWAKDGFLTVDWGTAFPHRWMIPLGSHVALRRITTPAMQVLDCCFLILEGPGGRVLLWAIPGEGAQALEQILREEMP